jgi:hypothetical protein
MPYLIQGQVSPEGAPRPASPTGWDQNWLTVEQLFEAAGERPDWIVEGIAARGSVTLLAAKIKVGKTHFLLNLVSGVLTGQKFLSRMTTKSPVLYLTEEGPSTFAAATRRVGIQAADNGLMVLPRHKTRGISWESIGKLTIQTAQSVESGLVVVDTLGDWADLGGDSENDAGAARMALRPVRAMADAGLAVICVQHERKSGGDVADAARGSSAFGGSADVLLSLSRSPGQGHDRRRELRALGRYDGIDPLLIVELGEDNRYRLLGTERAVQSKDAQRAILDTLPDKAEDAIAMKTLVERTRMSRTTLQNVLKKLEEEGVVQKELGAGEAEGNAHGYWLRETLEPAA